MVDCLICGRGFGWEYPGILHSQEKFTLAQHLIFMLPILSAQQNVFVEISNLKHGGLGWEFGTCLWSPEKDKRGSSAWKLMENIKEGDIILHFAKIRNNQHWYGVSVASNTIQKGLPTPPIPGNWANMKPYQRVNLSYFIPLQNPYPAKDFFRNYYQELNDLLPHQNSFYYNDPDSRVLKMQQRYIASCPAGVYEIFNSLSDNIGFTPIFASEEVFSPTADQPLAPDYSPPGRIKTSVSRIVRDTKLSRDTKANYEWKCQICGQSIVLPTGAKYAEGHHIKPLGGISQGPDTADNLIVLCPSHHTEFDFGSIAINPKTSLVVHIDESNGFHNQPLAYQRQDLNLDFLKYHYEERFNKS